MSSLRLDSCWEQEEDGNTSRHVTGDPIALIYNEGLWKINKVSPLYNLQYNGIKLKQYGSKILQALVSSLQMSNTAKYTVVLEELPLLKYSEEDSSGILITVRSSQEDSNTKKVAYVAILLSWGISISMENAIHLPYMLERGEQRVGTVVKTILQTAFDCNIKQFSFTQHQLLNFGFSFIDSDTSRSNDQFTLVYRSPQTEVKSKLSLSFDIGDVRLIWNGIKDETIKKADLIILAYQILQNQIFSLGYLDVTVFDLSEINLTKAEIKCNGGVKMKTPEIVNCVFTVLNEICCDLWQDLNITE
ncbi:uncharacterized protein LOC114243402 [Bombyx mandarina]|uniref:Centromere protein L n=1 Tax=Bombyx mandarina TaxID=7092 RepID=A0A6J2JNU3_BOMMA|nr:uncharacterized protein LOC114243402 [Bombyx mandarina]